MNGNLKMKLLTTFIYQVRAGENYDEFIGDETDYDFETAKKVYDENKKNHDKIAITMTPSLCEEEFNELADGLNIHLQYEVKYILEKDGENETCENCGDEYAEHGCDADHCWLTHKCADCDNYGDDVGDGKDENGNELNPRCSVCRKKYED